MNLLTTRFAVLRETARRQAFSRRYARESITRSPASDARKSLKLPVSVNTIE